MRLLFSAALSLLAGFFLLSHWAFPANDPVARLIALTHPLLIVCIAHTWTAFLFTTPMLLIYSGAGAFSLLDGRKQKPKAGKLPPLVPPQQRESLTLVLGEVHQQRAFEASANPQWLTIPAKGLYTGVAIFGAVGSGKCLAPGTKLVMYAGDLRNVEDVRVGDLLMGPDSKPRRVLSLAHGFDSMYRVIPKRGDPYEVNSSHILSFKMTRRSGEHKRKYKAGDIVNMPISDYIDCSRYLKINGLKGWKTGVEFQHKPVALDPYFLGLWLGDGSSSAAAITTADKEIADYLECFAFTNHLSLNARDSGGTRCPTYYLSGAGHHYNPIVNGLRRYNLLKRDRRVRGKGIRTRTVYVSDGRKHIPHDFKTNSREIRLAVLAGLLDSDGCLDGSKAGYEISTKIKELAHDIAFLVRSLGFYCSLRYKQKTYGTNGVVGDYFLLRINGDLSVVPVKIARKVPSPRKQKKNHLLTSVSVESIGYGEYFGFELDGDGLFLLGDFTVTHNTSGCMYPYANQLLSWMAHDPAKKIAGLILEVKGDFCRKVQQIMNDCGRGSDYIELAFDRRYRYNPLHSDLSASALAFKIASLVNNLYGAGKEPFWQQAYADLVTWIITLHRIVDGYLTMYDLFDCSIDQRKLQLKIEQGEEKFALDYVSISADDYKAHAELADRGFVPEEHGQGLITRTCPSLESLLAKLGIDFDLVSVLGTAPSDENARLFGECSKWLYKHWNELDLKLKTSIVAGLEVLISPFPLNPELLYTLCPPKEMYDPVANADGRYGLPFPKFDDLIRDGKVAALNFPIAADPAMSRLVATLMKMDFQSAMLRRIPTMTPDSRAAMFLCDEYHELATAGLRDPSGDDHFFALSRQAKCIPIIATQGIASLQSALPHDSWRTVLQCFRTKVFLAMADDVSAKTAADLCGHAQQLKLNYTLSESGQDAKVSLFTGRTGASKASMGASKAYHLQRDFIFEPFVFNQLANAQSIVLAYDGDNPHPPTICYLKPYWLPNTKTWFQQREEGLI